MSNKYPDLNQKILDVKPENRFINWVVQQELLYGVYRKQRLDLEIKYKKFFEVCNIIDSDKEIVDICAKLESLLESKGLIIGLEDIWIASTCLAKDLVLVTNNIKHFSHISELKVENWI
jgi:tRNA(fMet)-specific endonuclease VapC